MIYKCISALLDRFLCKIHGMRTLSSFDNFFLSDDRKCIIAACLRTTTKFDPVVMSDLIKTRLVRGIPGAAVRLVQVLGNNYWLKLNNGEIDEYWSRCCQTVTDIHTKEQLQEYLAKKIDEEYDLYGPVLPYKFFLIPDFMDGRGAIAFIITHAIIDGVNIAGVLQAMTNNQDFSVVGK